MIFAIPLPVFNPEIFSTEIFGIRFALHWYALSYIAGFLVARFWFVSLIERPQLWAGVPPMDRNAADQLLTWIIIGAIVGGRAGYVVFYNPLHYVDNPLEALAIWRGGMSFHGGLAGLVVATMLFCKRCHCSILRVGDAISVTAMPGLFLGRIANFINGELWGTPTNVPWAVIYPYGPASHCPETWTGVCSRHPSQLYEALLEGALLCVIFAYLAYRRGAFRIPGQLLGLFFAGYGTVRIFVEQFRHADATIRTVDNPHGYVVEIGDWGLSMGQFLSLPMVLLGIGMFLWARWKNR